jgi:hypothetical protein
MKATGVPIDEASLENRDTNLRRVITRGLLFGIPSVYLATLLIGLAAGVPWMSAAAFAVVPAIFGGPYFGGLAVLFHMQLVGDGAKTARRHSFRPHIRHRIKAV